jgi:hypothetical protein
MFWNKKPQIVYKVVEVKAPRKSQAWTKETKDAIGTLAHHPGFIALVERLDLQRQLLKEKCATQFHKDLMELAFNQAGVFWLGFMQDTISKATQVGPRTPVDPFEEELEGFKQLDAQIERVGMDPQGS